MKRILLAPFLFIGWLLLLPVRGVRALFAPKFIPMTPREPRMWSYPLGFKSATVIKPGETTTVITRPQLPFRGQRLTIPASIAARCEIYDLRIGKNSQMPANTPLPGECFSSLAAPMTWNMDTAQISQDVSIAVENISTEDLLFTAVITGTVME